MCACCGCCHSRRSQRNCLLVHWASDQQQTYVILSTIHSKFVPEFSLRQHGKHCVVLWCSGNSACNTPQSNSKCWYVRHAADSSIHNYQMVSLLLNTVLLCSLRAVTWPLSANYWANHCRVHDINTMNRLKQLRDKVIQSHGAQHFWFKLAHYPCCNDTTTGGSFHSVVWALNPVQMMVQPISETAATLFVQGKVVGQAEMCECEVLLSPCSTQVAAKQMAM